MQIFFSAHDDDGLFFSSFMILYSTGESRFMETILVSRAAEQHDLDRIPNRTRLAFSCRNVRLMLDLDIFHYGCDLREREYLFHHPAPPICRLFHFRGEVSPGAEIMSGGTLHRLDTKGIYLLNAEHSFEVRYLAGSRLCYAHLRLTDQTRRSVFLDSPGILRVENPATTACLEQAWETDNPLAIQSAVTMAMSDFLTPLLGRLCERGELFSGFAPMLAALDATPPAQFRVSELAETMNMTPFALSKRFNRKIRTPLKEFLNSIYLDRARELLFCSGGTIEEIARKLGHRDVHYFYHAFRKLTGISPGAYRANREHSGTEN